MKLAELVLEWLKNNNIEYISFDFGIDGMVPLSIKNGIINITDTKLIFSSKLLNYSWGDTYGRTIIDAADPEFFTKLKALCN